MPNPQQPQEGKQPDESVSQAIERSQLRTNQIIAACGVVGIVFAIIQFRCQWEATKKQIDIANAAVEQTERIMLLDQRPWIDTGLPVVDKPRPGERVSGKVQLTNSGKTPGKIVQESSHLFHFAMGVKCDWGILTADGHLHADTESIKQKIEQDATASTPAIIVAPGKTYDYPIMTRSALTGSHFQDLMGLGPPGMNFWVVRIVYADTTGETHSTLSWFCYLPSTGEWITYPKYNEMN